MVMHTEKPLLHIQNVALKFGGLVALEDVSFDVFPGQICGLIGPNGAGKSSLFNCVTRLYEPTGGSIEYKGESLLARRAREIVALGIARTFQDLSLFTELTVRQNVAMGAHHRLRSSVGGIMRRASRYVEEERLIDHELNGVLDVLALRDVQHMQVGDLPYGTMKRVELARVLLARPALVLLDEPASGLTQAEVLALAQLIVEIKNEYKLTVLLVEHHMGMVMKISDHIVVLNLGRNIADGDPQSIQSNPLVARAYLGD